MALKNFQIQAGRGNIFELNFDGKNVVVIDDSYNASVVSMKAGLKHAENLKKILGKKRLVAALGDMLELGDKSDELHEEVVNHLGQLEVDFAVMVGKKMGLSAQKNLTKSHLIFSDSSSANLEVRNFLRDGDLLYLKGSRGTKMEILIKNLL